MAERTKNRMKRAPRPSDAELPDPDQPLHPSSLSPLGIYLKTNGVSVSAFCKAAGMPYRTVYKHVNGEVEPSIAAAYEYERLTKGVVPIEAWLGMPSCRKQIAQWRNYQPKSSKPDGMPKDLKGDQG